MKNFNKNKLFLLIIIVFAVILRLCYLSHIPPSLYSDEVNQGYNAYSILTTGRDEHGYSLPISLRSFGDWKPPLQTYFMIPFIKIFGLNELSVRLPTVIVSILSLIIFYLFLKELYFFKQSKLALLSLFFLSISPWHILQSRASMLVMISLFFLQLGIYFFIIYYKNINNLLFSFSAFALSIYAYYGMRVIVPIIILGLIIIYRKNLISIKYKIFLSLILFSIIISPLLFSFFTNPNVLFGRAKTVSVFYDQGVNLKQWELYTQDGYNFPNLLSRFFHHSYVLYAKNILERYFSHFEGNYLTLYGDKAQPFQIPSNGIFYIIDLIFISSGIYFLFKKKRILYSLIFLWLITSIIPASLTFMTPSSNRTFNAVIPLVMLVSTGLYELNRTKIFFSNNLLIVVGIYIISFYLFLNHYFILLPKQYADWWGYGWKQTTQYLKDHSEEYQNIITYDIGMPYIYFLFYLDYSPDDYQKNAVRSYNPDEFGFEHVDSFDKYIFKDRSEWEIDKNNMFLNTLYIIPNSLGECPFETLNIFYYPNKEVFGRACIFR